MAKFEYNQSVFFEGKKVSIIKTITNRSSGITRYELANGLTVGEGQLSKVMPEVEDIIVKEITVTELDGSKECVITPRTSMRKYESKLPKTNQDVKK